MYCANCGNSLRPDTQICSVCGPASAASPELILPRPRMPQSVYCPSCGAYRDDSERYCGRCGAPPVQQARPSDAKFAKGKTAPNRERLLIPAVVALLVVAGGVAAYFALSSSSSTPSAHGATTSAVPHVSVAERAAAIESPVRIAQNKFVSATTSLSATDAGLAQLHRTAQSFSDTVRTARTEEDALSGKSTSDRAIVDSLQQMLSAQATFATTLLKAPTTMSGLTATFITTAQRQADALNSAAVAFGQLVPGGNPAAINASVWAKFQQAIADREHQDQVRTFVVKMENLLSQSAEGRSQLATALTQTQDHCSIPPDQAAEQFQEVAGNRQSLLDQVSALTVPADEASRAVLNLFQQALRHSIAADNAFAAWMNYLYNYYYEDPLGCPGNVPTDSNYQQAVNESGYATHAKTEFVAAFNRLARQFGLRDNWAASQI